MRLTLVRDERPALQRAILPNKNQFVWEAACSVGSLVMGACRINLNRLKPDPAR
jgi:hypothetical protein